MSNGRPKRDSQPQDEFARQRAGGRSGTRDNALVQPGLAPDSCGQRCPCKNHGIRTEVARKRQTRAHGRPDQLHNTGHESGMSLCALGFLQAQEKSRGYSIPEGMTPHEAEFCPRLQEVVCRSYPGSGTSGSCSAYCCRLPGLFAYDHAGSLRADGQTLPSIACHIATPTQPKHVQSPPLKTVCNAHQYYTPTKRATATNRGSASVPQRRGRASVGLTALLGNLPRFRFSIID